MVQDILKTSKHQNTQTRGCEMYYAARFRVVCDDFIVQQVKLDESAGRCMDYVWCMTSVRARLLYCEILGGGGDLGVRFHPAVKFDNWAADCRGFFRAP